MDIEWDEKTRLAFAMALINTHKRIKRNLIAFYVVRNSIGHEISDVKSFLSISKYSSKIIYRVV